MFIQTMPGGSGEVHAILFSSGLLQTWSITFHDSTAVRYSGLIDNFLFSLLVGLGPR